MTTTLFAVDTDGRDRALTRLLLTAEGRGAAVRGLTTADDGRTVLLWLAHRGGGAAVHLLQALQRRVGCMAVESVFLQAAPAPRRHRVHMVDDVVDVVLELHVDDMPVVAAADGPTVDVATARAVAACTGVQSVAGAWTCRTVHPSTGRSVAVARVGQTTVGGTGGTQEAAVLAALLILSATLSSGAAGGAASGPLAAGAFAGLATAPATATAGRELAHVGVPRDGVLTQSAVAPGS